MGNLLVLALAAAFYPTMLAIVVVVLTRPRPARLLAAYLAGGLLIALTIGFVVVFALEGAGVDPGGGSDTASAIIDIVVGTVAIALAVIIGTGRDPRPQRLKDRKDRKARSKASSDPETEKQSWTQRASGNDSLAVAFGLGVVLDLPSIWYLIALKDIATGGYSTSTEVLLIVGFNLIMFAVIEIPLIACLVAPERTAAVIARFVDWLRTHVRQLIAGVAGTIGVYLVVKGLVAL